MYSLSDFVFLYVSCDRVLVGLLLLGILILQKDIIAGAFIIGIELLLNFLLVYQIYKKFLINKKKKVSVE